MIAIAVTLSSRFEQLDWIAIGVFQLNLLATRTDLHLVAEMEPGCSKRLDAGPSTSGRILLRLQRNAPRGSSGTSRSTRRLTTGSVTQSSQSTSAPKAMSATRATTAMKDESNHCSRHSMARRWKS